ncbi:hypothetical protein N7456_013694 [Penicillium angulare]|uniref:Uncharacterized protein n=1 Tax=Penicillium angulare TaxID=116970 RepID=A0A9W9JSP0_9EURO|nr:hypothetical protein N7456_013694 [Penicillium angulare]
MATYDYNPGSSTSTKPGSLAIKARISSPGFSIARWIFWRLRLKELTSCKDEEISLLAEQSFDVMTDTV